MTYDELLFRVVEHTGLPGKDEAEPVVRTVLEAIAGRLHWPERQALAEDLPGALAERVRGAAEAPGLDLAQLHARVADLEHVRAGFAVEHTAVVCQAVAEALSTGTLHRLREALPDSMAALLTPRAPEGPPERVHLEPRHHTLAEGRPGSRHPLSEARPERAHTHSVVRSDNPHGDTKLSSASGLTQEREQETLATGRPGSSRPLSEAE